MGAGEKLLCDDGRDDGEGEEPTEDGEETPSYDAILDKRAKLGGSGVSLDFFRANWFNGRVGDFGSESPRVRFFEMSWDTSN